MFLWLLCIGLALLSAALAVKLWLMRSGLRDLLGQLEERLSSDTNNQLFLSCRDRQLRRLAVELNRQLAALRRLRCQYSQGDRELKTAVTNLSHDLRTPLAAICGYLDLLEQEALPPSSRQYLAVIRERAALMETLTEELFRYSVILNREQAAQPVCLNRALEESLAAFYTALSQRGIRPEIHMPECRVTRPLDPAALSRVFANLLTNAVRYSDGDLEISLSPSGEVRFSNRAAALSRVEVGQLFHRFFTVESARKTTGLGLSIAKTLTEQMGGSAEAIYEDGRLTVILRFPEGAAPALPPFGGEA